MGYQVVVSTRIWKKAVVGAVHAARLRDGCRAGVLALLLGWSAAACAQLLGQPGAAGMVTARWHASKDTDDFSVRRAAVGYLWNKGWGLEARTSHYSAPGWDASGTAVSGVYHSQTKERLLGARLGSDVTNGSQTTIGMLDYLRYLSPTTAVGISLERDVIDSVRSIESGINYTAGMLVLDHAFGPRASVGASLGNIWYSDGNERRQLRTRWNYELIQESGLNSYVKTRHFRNTEPYNGYYFAPEEAEEYSLGLSWRKALTDGVTLLLQGDAGRQFVDGEAKGLWNALVGLQSSHRARVRWRLALEARNDASSNRSVAAEDYRYTMLSGYLFLPLD